MENKDENQNLKQGNMESNMNETDRENDDKEEYEKDFGTVDNEAEKGDSNGQDKEDKGNGFVRELLSWVKIFVVAFIIAFIISHFIIVNANIPSGSMKTTINEGDKVIGFRLAYIFSDPKRGDIVMFEAPDKEDTIYIKRIVGLPGETIRIEDNTVYIIDKEGKETALEEDYVKNGWTNSAGPTEANEWTLGKDEYFMMGDNRDHSNDARYWGAVKRDKIIAKAIFRYYPSFKSLN